MQDRLAPVNVLHARLMVVKLTAAASDSEPVQEVVKEERHRVRQQVRLTTSELVRAVAFAKRAGFSLNR